MSKISLLNNFKTLSRNTTFINLRSMNKTPRGVLNTVGLSGGALLLSGYLSYSK